MAMKKYLSLNRQEFQYIVFEDFVTSMGMLSVIRFKTRHKSVEILNAVKHLLTIFPKLKGILKSNIFGYKLHILQKDEILDFYVNKSFDEIKNISYGSEEYFQFTNKLLNTPFCLEKELPLKIRYFPDEPLPILIFCVHHIIVDGRSWHYMLDALLADLNGETDHCLNFKYPPNIINALLQKPLYKVPQQLLRSYKLFREEVRMYKNSKTLSLSKSNQQNMKQINVFYGTICDDITLFKLKLTQSQYKISVLILAALVMTADQYARNHNDKNSMIRILVSVDLRHYFNNKNKFVFGNFVGPLTISLSYKNSKGLKILLENINTQFNEKLYDLKRKENILRFFIVRLLTFVGRKIYSRIIAKTIIKKQSAYPVTLHFSNIGSLDSLNSHGNRSKIKEIIPLFPNFNPFFTFSSFEGRLNCSFTYLKSEFTHIEAKKLFFILNDNFKYILNKLQKTRMIC